jgi:carbon storage regulator
MLILTRRVGQSIKIGDDVELTVVQISGDQVRLGINAPRTVRVYRAEVLEQIVSENLRAADIGDVEAALPTPPEEEKK